MPWGWGSIKEMLQDLAGQARGALPEGVTLELSFEGGGRESARQRKAKRAFLPL